MGALPAKIILVIAVAASVIAVSLRKPIIGLLFFLGLVFIRPQDDRPNLEALHLPYVFVVTLAILYLLWRGGGHGLLPKSRIVVPFGLFVLLMALSAYFGVAPETSLEPLKAFLVVVATVFFILAFVQDEQDLKLVFAVIVFCGLAFVYLAAFRGSDCIETFEGTGCGRRNFAKVNFNFGQPNYLGLSMVVMFNLATAFLYTYKNLLVRTVLLVAMVAFVVTLVETNSRGAFVAFAATLLFAWALRPHKFRNLMVLVTLAVIFWTLVPPEFVDRIATLESIESDTSAAKRLELWRIGLGLIEEYPMLGVGIGNFRVFAPNSPHNAVVQVASEIGVPALLCWVWLLGRAVESAIRARNLARGAGLPFLEHAAFGVAAALVAIAVQSMSTGLAHREFVYIMIGLAAAVEFICERRSAIAAPPAPEVAPRLPQQRSPFY